MPARYHDHNLAGDYAGFRECHIEPDWLLICRVEANELELFLFRTGTHSDLF
ncbi:MAG: type II toxin-antitoxin system YafQ family toxin [Erysipelotrichaceae bacterium]|nr:type II toxin-antitoxin system YafQ family toxin [Erysipelotrichaceae bacterium]